MVNITLSYDAMAFVAMINPEESLRRKNVLREMTAGLAVGAPEPATSAYNELSVASYKRQTVALTLAPGAEQRVVACNRDPVAFELEDGLTEVTHVVLFGGDNLAFSGPVELIDVPDTGPSRVCFAPGCIRLQVRAPGDEAAPKASSPIAEPAERVRRTVSDLMGTEALIRLDRVGRKARRARSWSRDLFSLTKHKRRSGTRGLEAIYRSKLRAAWAAGHMRRCPAYRRR